MSLSPTPGLSTMLLRQRERWEQGDCVRVEKLIDEHPALHQDAEPVLELLYQEMLLREERGEEPQLDEYVRRFPQYAGDLRLQFEIHTALSATGENKAADEPTSERKTAKGNGPRRPEVPGYEIVEELGRGGMGVVYKARQLKLNRIVALKMIRTGLLAGSQELSRFRREAEFVAQLQHPHIVQIHEVGESEGFPYLVLEFVDGTSLDRLLGGKPQPLEASARLIETLARAMHYAHVRGVVHRDLKPANVLLGRAPTGGDSLIKAPSSGATSSPPAPSGQAGKSPTSSARRQEQHKWTSSSPTVAASPLAADLVKITDFGLAKSLEPGTAGPTHTGDVLGTPSYMAPEQAAGKPGNVGFAADIYSLGAILYEMLTGRPPFVAETVLETLLQVRNQEPASPSRLRPNLPRDLVTICLTCLEKEPGRRYATAQELADDLRRYLAHEPIHARPTGLVDRGIKWARRHPTVASLIALVLLVSVAGFAFVSWQLKQTAAALAEARTANAAARAQNYLNAVALAHHELLGHHVDQAERLLEECPADRRGWEWHYLKRLCQTDLLTMSGHSSEVRTLAYSRDSRWIASGSGNWHPGPPDGDVKLWDAHTGKELFTLAHQTPTIFAVAFSPDCQVLAAAGRGGKIVLWNPNTGEKIGQLAEHGAIVHDLAFSPDSQRLVSSGVDLRIWEVQTGRLLHTLEQHTSNIWSVQWSPDGRFIVSTDWKGEIHLWNAQQGQHLRRVAQAVDLRTSCFSPDSKLLAAGSWDGSILIWKLDDLDAPPTVRNPNCGQIYELAFSPEGRRLAFCARDAVKIWDVKTGAELHDFAGHNGVAASLAFSPDGTRLATGGVDGKVKVWDATVREEFRRTLEANAAVRGFAVEPDGRLLALGSANSNVKGWEALTGKPVFTVPAQQTPLNAIAGDRDSKRVAWIGRDNTLCVWDRAAKRMTWTMSIANGPVTGLAFTPDGSQVAWGARDGLVHLADAATGREFPIVGESGSPLTGVAFHPQGGILATINEEGSYAVWDTATRTLVARFGGLSVPTADQSQREPESQTTPSLTRLAYSPDGRRLVSATRLRPPEVWDAAAGRLALVLDRAIDGGDCAGFTADGEELVVGLGGTLRVWNTARQEREDRLERARKNAIAWHRSGAQTGRNEKDWRSAALHLRYLTAAEPAIAAHHEQFANALASLGEWHQAQMENAEAIALGSRSMRAYWDRACLALRSGDQAAYREACADIRDNYRVTENPDTANFAAWVHTLSPNSGGDPLAYVALAEQALKKRPGFYSYLSTHAAALLRAGLYHDAIQELQTAIRVRDRTDTPGLDCALLALAYAYAGDTENSRLWLDQALATPDPEQWQLLVEFTILRNEARDALNSAPSQNSGAVNKALVQ